MTAPKHILTEQTDTNWLYSAERAEEICVLRTVTVIWQQIGFALHDSY